MKSLTVGALAFALPLTAAAQQESYTIDPVHSFVLFSIEHLGVMNFMGRFNRTNGKFTIDRAAKKGGVDLAVETASIDTGDNERGNRPRSRDEHLRSADFFNVAEFPRMAYKSTNVKFSGDNPVEIEGQLTLLGVTKPVNLKVDRWVCRENPFNKRSMCGGNASGALKRSEFGMKYMLQNNLLGDEVRLFLNVEGYKD